MRVVNVVDLFALKSRRDHPHGLDDATFTALFTDTAPLVVAFHGFPPTIHELLHHRPDPERFHVRGFIEEGGITTPFDMTARNEMSRYHLAIAAVQYAPRLRDKAASTDTCREQLAVGRAYVREHGSDPPEILNWRWGQRLAPPATTRRHNR